MEREAEKETKRKARQTQTTASTQKASSDKEKFIRAIFGKKLFQKSQNTSNNYTEQHQLTINKTNQMLAPENRSLIFTERTQTTRQTAQKQETKKDNISPLNVYEKMPMINRTVSLMSRPLGLRMEASGGGALTAWCVHARCAVPCPNLAQKKTTIIKNGAERRKATDQNGASVSVSC